MTSKAKEALDDLERTISTWHTSKYKACLHEDSQDTIHRALTILAAIESDEMKKDHEVRLSLMKESDFMNYGFNDCLDQLKRMGVEE